MAFEHFSAAARKARLLRMRAAFLADPTTYLDGDFSWVGRSNRARRVYVSITSTGGNGSQASPYSKGQWDAHQEDGTWVVFSGDFRGSGLTARKNGMTFDMRNATVSQGKRIAAASVTDVSATSWTKGDTTTATMPSLTYKVLSNSAANFTVTDAFVNVCVGGLPLRGLTRTHSANAGAIRVVSVSSSADTLYVRTPWELRADERVAVLTGSSFSSPVGGLSNETPYWVVNPSGFVSNTGMQTIQLATSRGGAPINFSASDASALTPVGTQYVHLFALHEGTPLAAIPNPATLQAGEFAYCPWEGAIYFRLSAAIGSSEVIVTSSQGAGIAINAREDVHVLGGTIYGCHRAILYDTGALNCGAWGVKALGGMRGICMQSSPVGTMTRFCEVAYTKYGLASEEASSAEVRTNHRYYYVHDVGNWIHNWADRQPLMISPGSTDSVFGYGLVEDCAVASFGSVQLPANQVAPIVSTWGTATNDGSAGITYEDIYFSRCYGPNAYNNTTEPEISGVTVRRCVFDMRGMGASEARGFAPIWALARDSSAPIVAECLLTVEDNIVLLDNAAQPAAQFDGGRQASGLLSAVSRNDRPVAVTLRRNIVYGGSGTDSALFIVQNLSNASSSASPVIDSDENTFCCPSMSNMVVAATASGAGTVWQTTVSEVAYIEQQVAMTATPGAAPTWTSGALTNEAASVVLSEGDMTALSLTYSAWGEPIGAVPRPWFARQHT